MVRKLNIDGDGQGDLAGHGGPHRAVMVYQLDSYQHWQSEFGLDSYEYGQFGENFTVEGLADDEVFIGDQFAIGEALFEVSQPRVTCYRVGLRMGQPRLPSLLVSHRRPGFYLRVLREGQVAAGQPIERVKRGAGTMSVAEVDGLLYLPGHDPADVERASRLPALSPGWVASFEAILTAAPGTSGNVGLNAEGLAPPPAWPGFRSVVVEQVAPETESVLSIRLAAADGTPFPPALPGQFVTLRLQVAAGEPAVARSYSLSNAPGSPDYRISVKREAHGLVSGYLHTSLRTGASIEMAAPRGRFILDSGAGPVVLLSAGIGATPVLAMLYALAKSAPSREVWWLQGARNSREHPFAAEVQQVLGQLPHAHRVICYSAPLAERSARSRLRRRRPAVRGGAARPGGAGHGAGLPLRAGRLHGRDAAGPARPRHGGGRRAHRDVRKRAGIDARDRGRAGQAAARAGGGAGNGTRGHVRP